MSGSHPKLGHTDRTKVRSWIELGHPSQCLYLHVHTRVIKYRHWMTTSHHMMTPQVEATQQLRGSSLSWDIPCPPGGCPPICPGYSWPVTFQSPLGHSRSSYFPMTPLESQPSRRSSYYSLISPMTLLLSQAIYEKELIQIHIPCDPFGVTAIQEKELTQQRPPQLQAKTSLLPDIHACRRLLTTLLKPLRLLSHHQLCQNLDRCLALPYREQPFDHRFCV